MFSKKSARSNCNMSRYFLMAVLAGTASASARNADSAESGQGLEWSITPYLWAVDTAFDLKLRDEPFDSGVLSFNELVGKTEMAVQAFIEASSRSGHFSGFVDVTYLDISDTSRPGPLNTETDSEQLFLDAAVAYWPAGVGNGFNVFGGLRYTDLDDDIRIREQGSPEELRIGLQRDFWDAQIGARYRLEIAKQWTLLTRGDYAFGDSEGIYLLEAVIEYAFGRNDQFGVLFGYRYKKSKFDKDGLEEDYTHKGPAVGFDFNF